MADTALHSRQQQFYIQAVSLLKPLFKKYKFRLCCGFAALLGVDVFQLWTPRFIKKAVDSINQGTSSQNILLRYAGYILLLALGIAVCRFFWRYLVIGFSRFVERDLRNRLICHLMSLDRCFYQRRTTGEIMALATNDLAAVQLACGMGMIAFLDAVVMTVAALGCMVYIHPVLTLIAVAPMPILAFSTRILSARLHKRFRKVQEKFSQLTEFSRSTLSSISLIKAYTQERSQVHRFGVLGESYIRHNLKLATVQGVLFPFSALVANLCLLLVLFFGGRLAIYGVISIGDLVAFFSYLFMLTWPMMALGWVTNLFQRGATSLARVEEIFQEQPLLGDVPGAERPRPSLGEISLDNLSFTYPGQHRPVLRSLSINIRPGLYGVVGKTGSGKTTLCNILARIYPVQKGAYKFNDEDVNDLSLKDLRGSIAYVPQETILFSGTIFFNITMGKKDAARQEVEAVARVSAIHEEIMALEKGYQTRVGEKGVKLSGGQRQRIALARALLLDRPVIIIDDGLSAVDTETEHNIIYRIIPYLTGRTCIIVSHRVAVVADCRDIIVLDEGQIVARGEHQTLLASNQFYRSIYHRQTNFGATVDK